MVTFKLRTECQEEAGNVQIEGRGCRQQEQQVIKYITEPLLPQNNDKTHNALGKVPCRPACSRDEKKTMVKKPPPPFRALEVCPLGFAFSFIQLLLVDKSSECWSPGPP